MLSQLRRILPAIALLASVTDNHPAAGQLFDRAGQIRESIALPFSKIAENRISSILRNSKPDQFEALLESLAEIEQEYGEKLIAVLPGRYINARDYCQRIRASLQPAGLQAYREKIDLQAKRRFDAAISDDTLQPLLEIVDRLFASRWGDDALLRLGDAAWERGDLNFARRYWRQLLPATASSPLAESAIDHVNYPADRDAATLAEVRARLVLATWASGDANQASQQLSAYAIKHPKDEGQIGGKFGLIVDLLTATLSEQIKGLPHNNQTLMFGANAARNGELHDEPTPRRISAAIEIPSANRFQLNYGDRAPAFRGRNVLPYFPVLDEHRVFVANAESIFGLRRSDLSAAWIEPVDGEPTSIADAELYRLPEAGQTAKRSTVGVARYSLALAGDHLLACMGQPIAARDPREVQPLVSRLVCLDVGRRQGSVAWTANAPTDWHFEGSPTVVRDAAYVVARRRVPQSELAVIAFDLHSGRRKWDRWVATLTAEPAADVNRISHLLLTAGEGLLYLSTNAGAVIAIDQRTGMTRWAITYVSDPPKDLWRLNDPQQWGLTPCVYYQGVVFAAPQDSPEIFAIDALSGHMLWKTRIADRVTDLLGVRNGRLIATGRSAWSIDANSGQVHWGHEKRNPEHFGFGRGTLFGDHLWWPKHDEIEVVELRSGRRVRRIPLGPRGVPGGNLIAAGDNLLVATQQGLVLLGRNPRKAAKLITLSGAIQNALVQSNSTP